MSMKWWAFAAVVLVASGCKSSNKTPKKEATERWNVARSGVMASLAEDQYRGGNFDKSRQSVDEALKLNPRDASLHVLSAKLAVEQGQLELAEQELSAARSLAPDLAEAYYLSGVVYQRWQKNETAYDFYRAAGEKAPAELSYLLAQAEMLVAMGREGEALPLLQAKVVYFEHSAAVRDAVGQLFAQAGRHREAADMFRQASVLATDDPSLRERLGLSLYFDKQFAAAGEVLARLVAEEPYGKRADLLAALAECEMQAGKFRDARRHFEAAAQLNPSMAGVWLGLGRAALQTGDFPRAELSLRKALSLDPRDGEPQLLLGYVRLRQNRFEEAMAAFRKASALDAKDTVSLCMVGYALEKLGRHDAALEYYAKALKLNPSDRMAAELMAGLDLHD